MNKTEFLQRASGAIWSMHRYASPEDMDAAMALVSELIEHEGCPDTYFDELRGIGSYKEAWQVGALVIKFATGGDTIEREIQVYSQAAEYGVQHIFAPSVFVPLPDGIHIRLTEMDEQEAFPGDWRYDAADDIGKAYRYAPPAAAYLIVQPLVGLIDDLTCHLSPASYLDNPLFLQGGGELSPEEYAVMNAPLEWMQALINKYGDLGYRDISWALRRMCIEDLHSGNVGWLGDLPVIIDWLSYQGQSILKCTS